MQNRLHVLGLAVSISLILLFAVSAVNSSTHPLSTAVLVADGVPLPPPEPRHITSIIDGVPLPPPEPRHIQNIVDGVPLPPPEPRHITNIIDGVPLPPPEPRM